MLSRRTLMFVALLAFAQGSAAAEPLFQRVVPLLIELPGWQAEKADGFSMDSGAGAMTMASRHYTKGAASMEVAVIAGEPAKAALAPISANLKIENAEGHMIVDSRDGFSFARSYNVADKSGGVIVKLADDAALNVNYKGISEDDAIDAAQKFDWKALASALAAK